MNWCHQLFPRARTQDNKGIEKEVTARCLVLVHKDPQLHVPPPPLAPCPLSSALRSLSLQRPCALHLRTQVEAPCGCVMLPGEPAGPCAYTRKGEHSPATGRAPRWGGRGVVCVCARMHEQACACVQASACAYVCACVCVPACVCCLHARESVAEDSRGGKQHRRTLQASSRSSTWVSMGHSLVLIIG